MACFNLFSRSTKNPSPYAPMKGPPTLLTGKMQDVDLSCKRTDGATKVVKWDAGLDAPAVPRKPARKCTPWHGGAGEQNDDTGLDKKVSWDVGLPQESDDESVASKTSLVRKMGRKSTPWHGSVKTAVLEDASVDAKPCIQWAENVDTHSIPAEVESVSSVSSSRRAGRKATPWPGEFKPPIDESADTNQRVRWAAEVDVQAISQESSPVSEMTSGSSGRHSGRKSTPFPGVLKSASEHVQWAEDADNKQESVVSGRRPGRKSTPWHGNVKPSTETGNNQRIIEFAEEPLEAPLSRQTVRKSTPWHGAKSTASPCQDSDDSDEEVANGRDVPADIPDANVPSAWLSFKPPIWWQCCAAPEIMPDVQTETNMPDGQVQT